MIQTKELSRIAIGTYRMYTEEHLRALKYALECGINVVDTASNYMNGESEMMIGQLSSVDKKSIFIISKAGYVQGKNLEILEKLNSQERAKAIQVSKSLLYCISPKYLIKQIDESRKRLDVDTIDCYLIHNPEYYLKHNAGSSHRLYKDLKLAFDTLEELRQARVIKYYGLSSNMIPIPIATNGVSLLRIINDLDLRNSHLGFKYIQFPYNLCEKDAYDKNYLDQSLINLIKNKTLVALSNRPLNAKSSKGFVRLADFKKETRSIQVLDQLDAATFNDLMTLLKNKLNEIDKSKSDIFSFQPIMTLMQYRKRFGNIETVAKYYNDHLLPFIRFLGSWLYLVGNNEIR